MCALESVKVNEVGGLVLKGGLTLDLISPGYIPRPSRAYFNGDFLELFFLVPSTYTLHVACTCWQFALLLRLLERSPTTVSFVEMKTSFVYVFE